MCDFGRRVDGLTDSRSISNCKQSATREHANPMTRSLFLVFVASSVTAQVPLRGLAYDSLHGRPLPGAFIGIIGMNVTAVSDSLGRFVLAGVPKGTHRVVMQHDVLDAIGLSAAGARAVVNTERDSVIVAVPSFATLWRAACGREAPTSADSGFVFGTVQRGGRQVPAATVAASWLDLYKDSTGTVRQKQKTMEADADSSGNFALCGVPTTTGLSLRASSGNSFGVWTDIDPLDKERISRRDLTIVSGVDVSPTEVPNLNRFTLDQLEAIEVYAGGAQVPPEYNRLNKSFCGTIFLHTKRGRSSLSGEGSP